MITSVQTLAVYLNIENMLVRFDGHDSYSYVCPDGSVTSTHPEGTYNRIPNVLPDIGEQFNDAMYSLVHPYLNQLVPLHGNHILSFVATLVYLVPICNSEDTHYEYGNWAFCKAQSSVECVKHTEPYIARRVKTAAPSALYQYA